MLRSAAPLLGGWTHDGSAGRMRLVAAADRRASLLIVLAAAVAAMASVVFELQLPTSVVQQPAPITIDLSATAPAVRSAPAAEPAGAPAAAQTTTTARSTTTTEAAALSRETSATLTSEAEAAAATTESEAAIADAGGVNDPASRIRDYLGLAAGAQLPVSFTYTVEAGDTALSIAARFGLEEDTVLFNNFDIHDPDHLNVGQALVLPPVDGLVYTVQTGDAFSNLMQNFQADESLTLAWPANGINSPSQIYAGQALLLVQGSASIASGSITSSGAAAVAWTMPEFRWPLGYDRISDPFGTSRANSYGYHTGTDFVAAVGTIVGSTWSGQVSVATWGPSYGNWVEIDHGGGYKSRYAHLDEIWVWEGQWVDVNEFIGTVGNTGSSSGAHLHFEIIINGQPVDPLLHLE